MANQDKYSRIFRDFQDLNILILGDVMIDAYLFGRVDRISPEAPVPIVSVHKREERLGGAANVALNIKSLGGTPWLCSVIGKDPKGAIFTGLLKEQGIESPGVVQSKNRITTTKFRIIGNNSQLLRVDEELTSDLNNEDTKTLIQAVKDITESKKIDAIIFQDYNKGILTHKIIRKIIQIGEEKGIPTAVDPKIKNFSMYKNITLFKPNLKELKSGMKTDFNHKDIKELNEVVLKMQEGQNIKNALVTLSEDGIYISSRTGNQRVIHSIPAHHRSIADVSGAGDTVLGVASMCLALKLSPYEIATLSNLAGGLVCEEVGVVPVNKHKFAEEIKKYDPA